MYKNKKIQNPTTGVRVDFSQLSHKILAQFPIGSVTSFIAGYFTANNNTGFTMPADPGYITINSIAAVNEYIRQKGFIVCDGTIYQDKDSPIYNGPNRYCPNITDDRFLMGSVILGTTGGDNRLRNHRHNYNFGTVDVSLPSFTPDSHIHYADVACNNDTHAGFLTWASHISGTSSPGGKYKLKCGNDETADVYASKGGWWSPTHPAPRIDVNFSGLRGGSDSESYGSADHRHIFSFQTSNRAAFDDDIDHTHPAASLSGNVGTPGAPLPTGGFYDTIDNRPKFLSCFYVQRVK